MGVIIRVKDANFSANPVGFVPPVVSGLSYWNFFGGSATHNGRNLAPDGASATVVGSPVVDATGARFSDGEPSYIDTGVTQTEDMTVIAVATPVIDTAQAQIISNYGSGPEGSSLFFLHGDPDDGQVLLQSTSTITDGTISATGPSGTIQVPVGAPQLVAGRARSSDLSRKLWGYTQDQVSESVYGGDWTGTVLGDTAMRVGSSSDESGDRAVVVHMAAIYNTALTDTQVEEVLAYLRAYYARRGITI